MELRIESKHVISPFPNTEECPMHAHDNYEIYCFVNGNAEYCVEGSRYPLLPGDIITLRKGEVHKVSFYSVDTYERRYVNFELPAVLDPGGSLLRPFLERPLGKCNHFPSAMFPGNHWLYYMKQLSDAKSREQKLCWLLPLLCELSQGFDAVTQHGSQADFQVAPIIGYINSHLTRELSLDHLCQQFHMSKTHLNRLFKQSTGTTVWEYIVLKRMFLAQELIAAGHAPTKIFSQCGFADYSTFFRAYKKHFGTSPKAHTH